MGRLERRPMHLLLVTMVITACGLQRNVAEESFPAGVVSPTPAPALVGRTLTGGRVDLTSMRGHAAVIDFWASWCGPCRAEQPELNKLYNQYAARGVGFVGVDFRDDDVDGLAFVRTFSVSYPSLSDPASSTAALWDVPAPPEVVVVDAEGQIRGRFLGTLTGVSALVDQIGKARSP